MLGGCPVRQAKTRLLLQHVGDIRIEFIDSGQSSTPLHFDSVKATFAEMNTFICHMFLLGSI